ncbi:MAG: PQQ-binding-like beta-propeller repeat protein, partial [Pirellulaceae bacterium]|nr:PQQ-binding-like beta-propeller repeat protein [Pirellulaceae bacterium]
MDTDQVLELTNMLFTQRRYCFWQLAIAVASLVTATAVTATAHAESNWPSWRGPAGSGHSADDALPVKWTDANLVWKTQLVGSGQSSPTVWGERIFLTSSTGKGSKRHVMCLDRSTGELLWAHVAWTGEPEKTHSMNQFASATCATDGEHVVAFFGKGGIHC